MHSFNETINEVNLYFALVSLQVIYLLTRFLAAKNFFQSKKDGGKALDVSYSALYKIIVLIKFFTLILTSCF